MGPVESWTAENRSCILQANSNPIRRVQVGRLTHLLLAKEALEQSTDGKTHFVNECLGGRMESEVLNDDKEVRMIEARLAGGWLELPEWQANTGVITTRGEL